MFKKIICVIISLIIIVSFTQATTFANAEVAISKEIVKENKIICNASINGNFATDEIIVVLNNKTSLELNSYDASDFKEVSAISVENLTKYSTDAIKQQREIKTVFEKTTISESISEDNYHQYFLIKLNKKSKENVLKSIKLLEQRDDVIFVSPNYIYTLDSSSSHDEATFDEISSDSSKPDATTTNDTNVGKQWALNQISLFSAWGVHQENSIVRVGVLDTGINDQHPDLQGKVNTSLSKDFSDENNPLYKSAGHGTAIAGIIGAKINNNTGIAGVCNSVSLVSLKVTYLNENGEHNVRSSYLCSAIDYASTNNIFILNYSSSGPDEDPLVKTKLQNYNGLFICSAGNVGTDIGTTGNYRYPAYFNTDNMICVANSTENDTLKTGDTPSCYSSKYVDLAAPGTSIYTTKGEGYATYTGTSVAAPYVTGVAALLKSKYPGMDAQALKYYIENNVDVIPELAGKVKTGGRLNAYKALSNLETFTVKYDANGGGGSPMADTTVIYGCSTPLSKNTYSRAGYAFKGWNIERADSGLWYYIKGTDKRWFKEGEQDPGYVKHTYKDETKVLRTTTNGKTVIMHAKWEEKINIEFLGNDATGGSADPMVIVTGETKYLPSVSAFERDGFTPKHWYAKNSDGEHYYTNGTTEGWYAVGSKPSGYTRVDFSGGPITTEDIISSEYGETIYMCAYWEPDFGVLGDADMSGKISVADATLIQKYISGQSATYPDNERWLLLADVDFDGNVTISDATLINKYIAKTIDEFGS